MASQKEKLIAEALKLVEKGQNERAVKLYLKVVAEDDKDVRVWLKIGDLYTKLRRNHEAAETYQRVALFYSEQGFYTKAIAVYKQILRLEPGMIEVHERLADLYKQMGLLPDAMEQYQAIASHHTARGDARAALAATKQMVELDPQNVAARVKLAEMYSKEEMVREAIDEFARAAESLKEQGRTDDYMKVAERLLFHAPENRPVSRELAREYLRKGDARRALPRLQVCFKADPRDPDTLTLLADAFESLGQGPKAVSVLKELARIHAENGATGDRDAIHRRVLQLDAGDSEAQAALRDSRVASASSSGVRDGARRTATPVASPSTTGRSTGANAPAGGTPSPVAVTPAPVAPPYRTPTPRPAPEPAPTGRTTGPQLDEDEAARVLAEVDVFVKYSLHAKALEHVDSALERSPGNVAAHEKRKSLLEGMGRPGDALEELRTLVALTAGTPRQVPFLRELAALAPSDATVALRAGGPGDLEPARVAMTASAPHAGYAAPAAMAAHAGDDYIDLGDDEETRAFTATSAPSPGAHSTGELPLDLPVDLDMDGIEDADLEPRAAGQGTADPVIELDDIDIDDEPLATTAFAPVGDDEVPLLEDDEFRVVIDGDAGAPTATTAPVEEYEDRFGADLDDEPAAAAEDPFEVVLPSGSPNDAPVALEGAQPALEESFAGLEDEDVVEQTTSSPAAVVAPPDDGDGVENFDFSSFDDPDLVAASHADPVLAAPSPAGAAALVDTHAPTVAQATDDATVDVDEAAPTISDEIDEPPATREDLPPVASLDAAELREDGSGGVLAVDEEEVVPPGHGSAIAELLPVLDGGGTHALTASSWDSPDPRTELPGADEGLENLAEHGLDTVGGAPVEALDDELAEVDFFIQQGLYDEARDALRDLLARSPAHPDVLARMAELAPIGRVDDATGALAVDDDASIHSTFEGTPSSPTQRRVVEMGVSEDDFESHFELGIAYKEMGLIDQALSEFQLAARSPARTVQCHLLAGLCFSEKRQPREAIAQFKQGLDAAGIHEDEELSLYYELGRAYESLPDKAEALYYFERVSKRKPKYRDVAQRLEAMSPAADYASAAHRK